MSRRRGPHTFTVVKDVISYSLGVGLILHQALIVPPPDFNPWLLALGGTLVGVPGFGQLIAMRTGGSPSPPPEEDSPPPPPPSHTASGADR
jgi:hypothetical protein